MRNKKFFAIFVIVFFSIFATNVVAQQTTQSGDFGGIKFQTYTWPYYTTRQILSPNNSPIVLQLPGGPNVGIKTGSNPVDNLLQIGQGDPWYGGLHICMKSEHGNLGFRIVNGSSQILSSQNIVFPPTGKKIGIWAENPTEALHVGGGARIEGPIYNDLLSGNLSGQVFTDCDGRFYTMPALDGHIVKQNPDGTYTHKVYYLGVLINESTDNTPPTPIELANTAYFDEKFSEIDNSEINKRELERLKNYLPASEYQKVVSENVDVSIFPNPCSETVTATSSSGEVVDMSIYDISGKKVGHEKGNMLNVSNLSTGTYIAIPKILLKK